MLLTGWKEIANYLRCGVRTAQRWEKYGLPVIRRLPGDRAPVHAESSELDTWLRNGRMRRTVDEELLANMERARKLREEIQQTRENLRLKLDALKKEVAALRARRRQN